MTSGIFGRKDGIKASCRQTVVKGAGMRLENADLREVRDVAVLIGDMFAIVELLQGSFDNLQRLVMDLRRRTDEIERRMACRA